jgi:hypothetical protein
MVFKPEDRRYERPPPEKATVPDSPALPAWNSFTLAFEAMSTETMVERYSCHYKPVTTLGNTPQ